MNSSNKYATSSSVTGKIYAADYTSPTPVYLTTAVSAMEAAYTDAMGRTLPTATELGTGDIGGLTITPGLYKWSTGVTILTDVILSGGPTDVWIFQIDGNLNISSGKSILLSGGALSQNIFWAVAGTTTLQTTSVFEGTILSGPGSSSISMQNGATLNGRALGQKEVTLIGNTIDKVTVTPNSNLIVTKVVINDNGRTNVISDFPLAVGSTTVISGTSNSFASGDYEVSEITNSNYTKSFSGDCDSNGSITLYPGINMACTITNNDIAEVSQGSSGGGTVYGCKDPLALNYNFFVANNKALCIYTNTPVVIVVPSKTVVPNTISTLTSTPISTILAIPTTIDISTTVIPKLPKTGFPEGKWYEYLLNNILNIFN